MNNEWKKIFNFNKYSINRKGLIRRDDNNFIYKTSIDNKGYSNIHLFNDNNNSYVNCQIHRLLALTYIPIPEYLKNKSFTNLVVNHIDGNKLNNDLSNLEWCTPLENNIHAFRKNLRKDNYAILVRDIKTNEVKRFYSTSHCGNYFSVSHGTISSYLKPKNYGKVQMAYYVFIKEDNTWPTWIDCSKCKIVIPLYIVKSRLNPEEKCIVYDSIDELSLIYNIDINLLKKWLFTGDKGNHPIYDFYNICNYNTFDNIDYRSNITKNIHKNKGKKRDLKTMPTNNFPNKLKVINLDTGESLIWGSSKEYADHIGVSKKTLQHRIHYNKGVIKDKVLGNLKFEYLEKNLNYKQ